LSHGKVFYLMDQSQLILVNHKEDDALLKTGCIYIGRGTGTVTKLVDPTDNTLVINKVQG